MARGGARVSIEDLDDEFDLGKLIGTYRLNTPLTVFTRVVGTAWLIIYALLALVWTGSAHGVLLIVLAVVIILLIGWRWLAKRWNLHRCLTYEEALVTTGWSGRVRDWVLRSEINQVLETRVRVNGIHTSSGYRITRTDGHVLKLLTPARSRGLRGDISLLASRTRPAGTA